MARRVVKGFGLSYLMQAKLAADRDLTLRITACAVGEKIPNPQFWVQQHLWEFAVQPGWDESYAASVDAGGKSPGADGSVITDAMILGAVRLVADSPPDVVDSDPAD